MQYEAAMIKLDLKKELKTLYNQPAKAPAFVDVPPMNYLMIDGTGNPNTSHDYAAAVEALYALSYALKFAVKKRDGGIDYAVMPLEGLWWAEDMRRFSVERKDEWLWTMLIMQPEYVTDQLVTDIRAEVARKKLLPTLGRIRFEGYDEGRAAQILHLGPYAAEGPTIAALYAFIAAHGYALRGKHHEIYLGDPRKTAPDRLRTIIRQPLA
jgi:hypothetical protein